jgi:hypothetical protein
MECVVFSHRSQCRCTMLFRAELLGLAALSGGCIGAVVLADGQAAASHCTGVAGMQHNSRTSTSDAVHAARLTVLPVLVGGPQRGLLRQQRCALVLVVQVVHQEAQHAQQLHGSLKVQPTHCHMCNLAGAATSPGLLGLSAAEQQGMRCGCRTCKACRLSRYVVQVWFRYHLVIVVYIWTLLI